MHWISLSLKIKHCCFCPLSIGGNENRGQLYMRRGAPPMTFPLTFEVFDTFYQLGTDATVNVEVNYLEDEAVMSSGSMLLTGG